MRNEGIACGDDYCRGRPEVTRAQNLHKFGVPLGGARLESSQTMSVYKDGQAFCPYIILHFFKELTYSSTNVQKHMI